MPIYEYVCPEHGKLELLFHKPNTVDEIQCPVGVMFNPVDPCIAERVWSLPTMRPDKFWAGHIVQGEYVTSQAEVSALMDGIEPASRENREYVQKRADQVREEEFKKKQNYLHHFLNEELRGVDDTTFAPEKHETAKDYQEANRQKNAWLLSQGKE